MGYYGLDIEEKRIEGSFLMKRAKLILAVVGLIAILVGCFVASNYIKKYTPSKEYADLIEYFSIEADDECALIKDTELLGEKVLIINNENYIPLHQ